MNTSKVKIFSLNGRTNPHGCTWCVAAGATFNNYILCSTATELEHFTNGFLFPSVSPILFLFARKSAMTFKQFIKDLVRK